MKLIAEEVIETNFITEEVNGQKNLYLEGIFLQSNVVNKNGRWYPRELLEKEVGRYNKDYINRRRAYGELGHPDSPSINLDRVSHMIVDLHPDGNNFVGKAKVLNTPNGNIVRGLIEGGGSLGVSTRGVGSLKPHNGYQLVQDDFRLATAADVVADPSAPGAFVQGIMEEAEWALTPTGHWKLQDYEQSRKMIQEASKTEIEATALKIFTNFVSKISK